MRTSKVVPEYKIELFKKLQTVSKDMDFVTGVISNLRGKEEYFRAMTKYIDDGKDVTKENISLLSLYFSHKGRK